MFCIISNPYILFLIFHDIFNICLNSFTFTGRGGFRNRGGRKSRSRSPLRSRTRSPTPRRRSPRRRSPRRRSPRRRSRTDSPRSPSGKCEEKSSQSESDERKLAQALINIIGGPRADTGGQDNINLSGEKEPVALSQKEEQPSEEAKPLNNAPLGSDSSLDQINEHIDNEERKKNGSSSPKKLLSEDLDQLDGSSSHNKNSEDTKDEPESTSGNIKENQIYVESNEPKIDHVHSEKANHHINGSTEPNLSEKQQNSESPSRSVPIDQMNHCKEKTAEESGISENQFQNTTVNGADSQINTTKTNGHTLDPPNSSSAVTNTERLNTHSYDPVRNVNAPPTEQQHGHRTGGPPSQQEPHHNMSGSHNHGNMMSVPPEHMRQMMMGSQPDHYMGNHHGQSRQPLNNGVQDLPRHMMNVPQHDPSRMMGIQQNEGHHFQVRHMGPPPMDPNQRNPMGVHIQRGMVGMHQEPPRMMGGPQNNGHMPRMGFPHNDGFMAGPQDQRFMGMPHQDQRHNGFDRAPRHIGDGRGMMGGGDPPRFMMSGFPPPPLHEQHYYSLPNNGGQYNPELLKQLPDKTGQPPPPFFQPQQQWQWSGPPLPESILFQPPPPPPPS
ncbi:serine/arginine repetitive matrix protein 1 [Halyomorpha halys]|uniref:serine/arginine repetitive matrix protein 1 n=1 Tax=Halyomorpha halys TaxID=286706 RepID=UPI0006D4E00D|nr:serine/arginine repetitive matrix protein 1-like [Halyomorpha halys]